MMLLALLLGIALGGAATYQWIDSIKDLAKARADRERKELQAEIRQLRAQVAWWINREPGSPPVPAQYKAKPSTCDLEALDSHG
jgi:hypothetical protein